MIGCQRVLIAKCDYSYIGLAHAMEDRRFQMICGAVLSSNPTGQLRGVGVSIRDAVPTNA